MQGGEFPDLPTEREVGPTSHFGVKLAGRGDD